MQKFSKLETEQLRSLIDGPRKCIGFEFFRTKVRGKSRVVIGTWDNVAFQPIGILLKLEEMQSLRGKCPVPATRWQWPLPGVPKSAIPPAGHRSSFGFKRPYEVHTGTDVYCRVGQQVVAALPGVVYIVAPFTGRAAGSPQLHATQAVVVGPPNLAQGPTILYGEIVLAPGIRPGMSVRAGDVLGHVLRVQDSFPSTMLHLELWNSPSAVGRRYVGQAGEEAVDWPLNALRPEGLYDPAPFLRASFLTSHRRKA